MARREEIEVLLRLRDEMSAALKKVSGESEKTTGSLKAGWGQVAAATLAVAGTIATLKKAYDFGREGAELSRLRDASRAMASGMGQDMSAIIASIRSASNNTITEMDAMGVAARGLQLGVARTPEEFEKLTKSSLALGRAMGRDALEAINDITTGVGRMSPLILDNLGILTGGEKGFEAYAKSIGKTADKLTDAEKKQYLLNKAMDSATPLLDENGELINDAATAYERLGVATADAKNRLKEQINEAILPAVNLLADFVEGENDLAYALGNTGAIQRTSGAGWAEHGDAVYRVGNQYFRTREELISYSNYLDVSDERQRKAALSAEGVRDSFEEASHGFAELGQFVRDTTSQFPTTIAVHPDFGSFREEFSRAVLGGELLSDLPEVLVQNWRMGVLSDDQVQDITQQAETIDLAIGVVADPTKLDAAKETLAKDLGIDETQASAMLQPWIDKIQVDGIGAVEDWRVQFEDIISQTIPTAQESLQTKIVDTLKKANDRSSAIARDIASLDGKEVHVYVITHRINEYGSGPGLQHGGFLSSGWNLVGEAGQELIGPGGFVFDAATTRKLLASGMLPRFESHALGTEGYSGVDKPREIYAYRTLEEKDREGGAPPPAAEEPTPPPPVQSIVEEISPVIEQAISFAVQTSGQQTAKIVREVIAQQQTQQQKALDIAQQTLEAVRRQPTLDDARNIASDSRNTSGF